jgi:hypothetical protein
MKYEMVWGREDERRVETEGQNKIPVSVARGCLSSRRLIGEIACRLGLRSRTVEETLRLLPSLFRLGSRWELQAEEETLGRRPFLYRVRSQWEFQTRTARLVLKEVSTEHDWGIYQDQVWF